MDRADRDTEEMRRRYRYRDLVLRGKVRLGLLAARGLIGPDCAYHLYRADLPADGSAGDGRRES